MSQPMTDKSLPVITVTWNGEPSVVAEIPGDTTPIEQHAMAMEILAMALAEMAQHTPFIATPDSEADDA